MSERESARFAEELLAGRRPRPFRPDEADAEQMRAAIELRAARLGSEAPSEQFLAELRGRLAAEIEEGPAHPGGGSTRRRQVLVGTSAAAAAAAVGGVVGHTITGAKEPAAQQDLTPNEGAWRPVAASADVPEGAVVHFDLGVVSGFVRRDKGVAVAVSGVCTHQGCKLWLDAPADRLRCPCHSTSFAVDGRVITHQLPISPAPLPRLRVRENDGAIEVFAPAQPA
ncbi:QcrA and Rieske domain-containing protein [Nocardia pseudobrasiliensis]|uniref:Nitrite reductase/ring-hydroxylating ferredoxin subunit n=1 Tax=Nocardia pseudobrasiliensis TaxID=45979 RepID=A0A370IBN9_9NOCA|nr:Rieske (2Fe-2S) protein [Nocardia pseudobrasiliensis]RDI68030.1 nitrite reductase/ring-hydroxylating ferredoxin subunit [Nocardia pseudobrasiliensis]